MNEVARKRGRPRNSSADREILDAAIDLLRECGYRDFTVDTIAARTGIAKTTIYRRWSTKAELIAAAIAPLAPDLPADAIVADAERVLALIRAADTIDIIRAVIAPRHAALAALIGRNEAEVRIGRMLAKWMLEE